MAIASRTHEANNEALRVKLVMINTHRSPCKIVCVKVFFCFFSISAKSVNIWIWMSSGLEELEEFLPITMGIIKTFLDWVCINWYGVGCCMLERYAWKYNCTIRRDEQIAMLVRYALKICSLGRFAGKFSNWKIKCSKNDFNILCPYYLLSFGFSDFLPS